MDDDTEAPAHARFNQGRLIMLVLGGIFSYHVLWPEGFDATFEWFSALIGALAFIALFKYKAGIMQVIGACAVLGLGYSILL
jgi:chromate transporter